MNRARAPAGPAIPPAHDHRNTWNLMLGAMGVVFGDIGTSPLYALRETFLHDSSMAPTPEHVLGVLSVLFWAITLTMPDVFWPVLHPKRMLNGTLKVIW